MIHLITCHDIAVDAKFIQQIFVGERISLTDGNAFCQHTIRAIGFLWYRAVSKTLFVILTVQNDIIMQCDRDL